MEKPQSEKRCSTREKGHISHQWWSPYWRNRFISTKSYTHVSATDNPIVQPLQQHRPAGFTIPPDSSSHESMLAAFHLYPLCAEFGDPLQTLIVSYLQVFARATMTTNVVSRFVRISFCRQGNRFFQIPNILSTKPLAAVWQVLYHFSVGAERFRMGIIR